MDFVWIRFLVWHTNALSHQLKQTPHSTSFFSYEHTLDLRQGRIKHEDHHLAHNTKVFGAKEKHLLKVRHESFAIIFLFRCWFFSFCFLRSSLGSHFVFLISIFAVQTLYSKSVYKSFYMSDSSDRQRFESINLQ